LTVIAPEVPEARLNVASVLFTATVAGSPVETVTVP
jgi:hypothetical protein